MNEKPSLHHFEKLSVLNQAKTEFIVHLKGKPKLYVMKVLYKYVSDRPDPEFLSKFEAGLPYVSPIIYHYVHHGNLSDP